MTVDMMKCEVGERSDNYSTESDAKFLPPKPKILTPDAQNSYPRGPKFFTRSPKSLPPRPKILTPDIQNSYSRGPKFFHPKSKMAQNSYPRHAQFLVPTPKILPPESQNNPKFFPPEGQNSYFRGLKFLPPNPEACFSPGKNFVAC